MQTYMGTNGGRTADAGNLAFIKVNGDVNYPRPVMDGNSTPSNSNLSHARDNSRIAPNGIERSYFNTIVCENNPITTMCLWENPYHGSRLVSGDSNGNLHWQQMGTTERGIIEGVHERSISALCSMPNGMLATGSADKVINLISPKKMIIKQSLTGHNFKVNALCAGNDMNTLYSGARDGTVRVWDVNEGKQIASSWQEHNVVTSIVPLHAQQTPVFGGGAFLQTSEEPVVRLWTSKGASLDERARFHSGPDPVVCADTTRDGHYLAVGTKGFSKGQANVLVWDTRKLSSGLSAGLQSFTPESNPALLYKFESCQRTLQAVKFVTASSVLAVAADGCVVRANFVNGSLTYLKDASRNPDGPLLPPFDPHDPSTYPENNPWDSSKKHRGYTAAELDPASLRPLNATTPPKTREQLEQEEDDALLQPRGVTAAFILPRLRKRRLAAYCAEWPATSAQHLSMANGALLITASPAGAADGKGLLGGASSPSLPAIEMLEQMASSTSINGPPSPGLSLMVQKARKREGDLSPSSSFTPLRCRSSDQLTSLAGSAFDRGGQRSPTDLSPRLAASPDPWNRPQSPPSVALSHQRFGSGSLCGSMASSNPQRTLFRTGGLGIKNVLDGTGEGSVIRLWEAHEKKFYAIKRKSREEEERDNARLAAQQQQQQQQQARPGSPQAPPLAGQPHQAGYPANHNPPSPTRQVGAPAPQRYA